MNKQRLLILAALFVGAALFPYGWLADQWPAFGAGFNAVFGSELGHLIGHSGIFFGAGLGLLWVAPTLRARLPLFLALILGLGVAQEGIQLVYKGFAPGRAELFDLCTDVAAGFLAWLLVRALRSRCTGSAHP